MAELKKMRIISEEEIPAKIKKRESEWLEMIQRIPKGKAWIVTEEEAGVKAISLKTTVNRLIKSGLLSDNFKVIRRTGMNGKVTMYVVNSAKGAEQ